MTKQNKNVKYTQKHKNTTYILWLFFRHTELQTRKVLVSIYKKVGYAIFSVITYPGVENRGKIVSGTSA